jgi:hypothetical protein
MARKLKTYQTSLGFFDQAIAAPSMKAALKAWGADSNLFHQGAAKESDDPDVIAATMAKPGVVLKRPVGTDGPFGEDAGLPTGLGRIGPKSGRAPKMRRPKSTAAPVDKAAERKAALAYDREQKRREREQAKEETVRRKERERRQQDIDNAEAALDEAERKHAGKVAALQQQLDTLEKQLRSENLRWQEESQKLKAVLREAKN